MTVGELLERIDSRELTEWQAYEAVCGPVGGDYRDVTLAAIHDQLQMIARIGGGQYKSNPAPKPKPYPKPYEIADMAKRQVEQEGRMLRTFGAAEEE